MKTVQNLPLMLTTDNTFVINIFPVVTLFIRQKTLYRHTSKILYLTFEFILYCTVRIVLYWMFFSFLLLYFSALVANTAIDWRISVVWRRWCFVRWNAKKRQTVNNPVIEWTVCPNLHKIGSFQQYVLFHKSRLPTNFQQAAAKPSITHSTKNSKSSRVPTTDIPSMTDVN